MRIMRQLNPAIILWLCGLIFSYTYDANGAIYKGYTGIGQTNEPGSLEQKLFQAFKHNEFSRALTIAEKMHQIDPNDIDAIYNIAILHVKLGNERRAFEWFIKAVEAGGLRSFRRAYYERYIAVLEHQDRDSYQKPEKVMAVLSFKSGEKVADIGAGSGYFTLRIARAVGPEGLVWAVDIEQTFLDHIEKRIKEENLANVRLNLVTARDPQLPAKSLNTILLVHTYAYIHDRVEYAKKLREALVPEGRVVIIEYIPTSWEKRPWGPLPHQQVSRKIVDEEMTQAGFNPDKIHGFLPGQYFVEYKIQKRF